MSGAESNLIATKLWLLEVIEEPVYNQKHKMLIRATSEESAREMAGESDIVNQDYWLSPDKVLCRCCGDFGEPGVIIEGVFQD